MSKGVLQFRASDAVAFGDGVAPLCALWQKLAPHPQDRRPAGAAVRGLLFDPPAPRPLEDRPCQAGA